MEKAAALKAQQDGNVVSLGEEERARDASRASAASTLQKFARKRYDLAAPCVPCVGCRQSSPTTSDSANPGFDARTSGSSARCTEPSVSATSGGRRESG